MTDALKSVSYRTGPLTATDYDEAIDALRDAKAQDQAAPVCCAICTDGSHTAESCHHNPLVLARRWAQATSVWACYHCGFTAADDQEAREHFGGCDQEDPSCIAALKARMGELEAQKDEAYSERNRLVAWLARCFPSGTAKTDIPGWDPEWHGCVYIDLPTGQASWHYHDSEAGLFLGLPAYRGVWDGHTTEQKYERLAALWDGYAATQVKARAALKQEQPAILKARAAGERE